MMTRSRALVLVALGAASLGFVACQTGAGSAGEEPADASEVVPIAPLVLDPRREDDRATRASRRAFYTAPPVIPHEGAAGRGAGGCLQCHGEAGTTTPHPQFGNCMQCHVAAESPFGEPAALAENGFVGLEPPRSVEPAAAETPPGIPHRLALRETCIACHGPDGIYESLHTPHPERVNCRQCHLPLAGMEFAR